MRKWSQITLDVYNLRESVHYARFAVLLTGINHIFFVQKLVGH